MKKERDELLNFETFGYSNSPSIILIHGLFGSWENLKLVAKHLESSHYVICVDCRNHGKSFHERSMSYNDMAKDIETVIEHLNLTHPIIVGHSMGGKIAMQIGLRNKKNIEKLIVIDIAPKTYPPHHQGILTALEALQLNEFKSKTQVSEALKTSIPNLSLLQILVKNIERVESGLIWKINLSAIINEYKTISEFPIDANKCQIPTLFIRGTQSNYIEKNDENAIQSCFQSLR